MMVILFRMLLICIDNLGNKKRVNNTLIVRQYRERASPNVRRLHVGSVITVTQRTQAERQSLMSAVKLEPVSMRCCSCSRVQVKNG